MPIPVKAIVSATAPSPDPRVGLKAGWWDAGQAAWNMNLVSSTPPSGKSFGATHSDLAFSGKYTIQGQYNGFDIWDVSNAENPVLANQYNSPASQNDVSVYKNLLFMSSESGTSRVDCGFGGVPDPISKDRVRGIRVFDISDIKNPKLVTSVQTCRGSHTHTVVEQPGDKDNIYIYVSGSSGIRSADEKAGCVADPNAPIQDLSGLRTLAVLGDSVTTDHISPAGNIPKDSPAGKYLMEHGVAPADFNSYGARRGNHEVMVRGTLANIRLRNLLALGTEGGWTTHIPSNEKMFIYDAAVKYAEAKTPLMIIAGKEYGSGSSRDWAAKGVLLLGVRAVIAESFERIHRSNLVGMGVLPLQFLPGETRDTLGLTGFETFAISGVASGATGSKRATVTATDADGVTKSFDVVIRIDTPQEVEYFRNGGILPYVLRQVAAAAGANAALV